ncbi:MAG: sulfite oxidase heme-binding subunit YedZ [Alphaproteobacteria bacterium]
MWPWHDYSGRLSWFKLGVFLGLFVPGAFLAADYIMGNLGGRPANEAVREVGRWMIRFLFISLAVTPLRESLGLTRLVEVRRMIGVAAFAYGFAHITLYAVQEKWNLLFVVTEIVKRIYLTVGFVGLVGLAVLAATSTDGWMRRLGPRWQKLHRIIYVIAVLAAVHFFMQSKATVTEPILMMGFYLWLMAARMYSHRLGRRRPGGIALAVIGAASAVATALGEAGYYAIKLGVDPLMILAANFAAIAFRPAWGVAIAAAVVLALALGRMGWRRFNAARAAAGAGTAA